MILNEIIYMIVMRMYSENVMKTVNFVLRAVELMAIKNVLHAILVYYILIKIQGIVILMRA